jgi:hypothetical protein
LNDGRNFDGEPVIAAVVGCQGQGKSTLQRQLLRSWNASVIAIFDHKAQFERLLPAFGARSKVEMEAALAQTHSVCFVPWKLYGEQFEDAFQDFCLWFWARQQKMSGRKLLVFDEAGDMVPEAHSLWKKHPLRKFTNTGREFGCDVLTAAQAPTDIPLKFRNQVTDWYVFKLGAVECLDPLLNKGFKWADVDALQRGQFIHYNGKTGELRRGVTKKDA